MCAWCCGVVSLRSLHVREVSLSRMLKAKAKSSTHQNQCQPRVLIVVTPSGSLRKLLAISLFNYLSFCLLCQGRAFMIQLTVFWPRLSTSVSLKEQVLDQAECWPRRLDYSKTTALSQKVSRWRAMLRRVVMFRKGVCFCICSALNQELKRRHKDPLAEIPKPKTLKPQRFDEMSFCSSLLGTPGTFSGAFSGVGFRVSKAGSGFGLAGGSSMRLGNADYRDFILQSLMVSQERNPRPRSGLQSFNLACLVDFLHLVARQLCRGHLHARVVFELAWIIPG